MRKPGTSWLRTLLVVLAAASSGGSVAGQEARIVPTWHPVYHDIDRLVDAGLLPELPVGQRPWSVRQLRRAVAGARERLDARASGPASRHLDEVLDRLERGLSPPAPTVGVPDVLFEALAGNGSTRSTPDNGLGQIEDAVNPMFAYRGGRHAPDGGLVSGEPAAVWAPSDRFALEVRPRLQLGSDAGGDIDAFRMTTLQARAVLGSLALTVGRGEVVWGALRDESLMLSGNARGLDRIEVATDVPVEIGFLGPSRFTVFLADLGEDRIRSHAKLLGAKLSVRPHPRLELGWSYLNEQAGEGAPEASFWERVADVLIVPDLFRAEGDFEFSEKLMGGDIRWWVPSSVGLQLFLEGGLTDFDVSRIGSLVRDDASWRGGVELSRLGGRGAGWLRLSGARTGLRWYRHTQFPSGLTLDGAVLGSALGPHGRGVRLRGGWHDPGGRRWEGSLAWESRSADVYGFQPEERPVFPKLEDRPEERRLRADVVVGWPTRAVDLEVHGGVERTRDFGFLPGEDRTVGYVVVRALLRPR